MTTVTTASARTLNIPLARKVLEHLVAHPEEHNQNNFGAQAACGTTMCIAGTVLWMSPGARYIWQDGLMADAFGDLPDEDPRSIEHQAATFLGMNLGEATDLFYTFDNRQALDGLNAHIEAAEAVQHA